MSYCFGSIPVMTYVLRAIGGAPPAVGTLLLAGSTFNLLLADGSSQLKLAGG